MTMATFKGLVIEPKTSDASLTWLLMDQPILQRVKKIIHLPSSLPATITVRYAWLTSQRSLDNVAKSGSNGWWLGSELTILVLCAQPCDGPILVLVFPTKPAPNSASNN